MKKDKTKTKDISGKHNGHTIIMHFKIQFRLYFFSVFVFVACGIQWKNFNSELMIVNVWRIFLESYHSRKIFTCVLIFHASIKMLILFLISTKTKSISDVDMVKKKINFRLVHHHHHDVRLIYSQINQQTEIKLETIDKIIVGGGYEIDFFYL